MGCMQLSAVWQSGTIPPDWKRGLVVPIWKGKGCRQDCNNYSDITLLSVADKVLAHLLTDASLIPASEVPEA